MNESKASGEFSSPLAPPYTPFLLLCLKIKHLSRIVTNYGTTVGDYNYRFFVIEAYTHKLKALRKNILPIALKVLRSTKGVALNI